MTSLVIRIEEAQPVTGRWYGASGSSAAVTVARAPSAIAAVIGPPGPASDQLTVIAAEPLGGQRAVTADGYLCLPTLLDRLLGITKHAGTTGDVVAVQDRGLMEDASWNWTPNAPVFITGAGVLTQTPPVSGAVRRIAWAVSATGINIDLIVPIQLT
jgi:hypothetical protein